MPETPERRRVARLTPAIKTKILTFPEYSMGAHRVDLVLRDGSVVRDVMVAWGDTVVRTGDHTFDPADVVDATDQERRG